MFPIPEETAYKRSSTYNMDVSSQGKKRRNFYKCEDKEDKDDESIVRSLEDDEEQEDDRLYVVVHRDPADDPRMNEPFDDELRLPYIHIRTPSDSDSN